MIHATMTTPLTPPSGLPPCPVPSAADRAAFADADRAARLAHGATPVLGGPVPDAILQALDDSERSVGALAFRRACEPHPALVATLPIGDQR